MSPNLKAKAYDHILDQILLGGIGPGARLSDIRLAKEIGISRTPVREAIILMETQGLVEQVDGAGPRVRNFERPDLEEMFELREMLEVAAIGKAVERITAPELAELQANCDQYVALTRRLRKAKSAAETEKTFDRLVVLDMAFHLTIMCAARNRRLLQIMGDLHVLSRILRRRADLPTMSTLARSARAWRDHLRVVRAMARRDVAAAQFWMRRHIVRACKYHLDAFDWQQRQIGIGGGGNGNLPSHVARLLSGMESGGPVPPLPPAATRRAARRSSAGRRGTPRY